MTAGRRGIITHSAEQGDLAPTPPLLHHPHGSAEPIDSSRQRLLRKPLNAAMIKRRSARHLGLRVEERGCGGTTHLQCCREARCPGAACRCPSPPCVDWCVVADDMVHACAAHAQEPQTNRERAGRAAICFQSWQGGAQRTPTHQNRSNAISTLSSYLTLIFPANGASYRCSARNEELE